ncbi:hypothetical protein ACL6C3_23385 [Capilliphycus salinus ALCB114379]
MLWLFGVRSSVVRRSPVHCRCTGAARAGRGLHQGTLASVALVLRVEGK